MSIFGSVVGEIVTLNVEDVVGFDASGDKVIGGSR
jgi:hypothetical protein